MKMHTGRGPLAGPVVTAACYITNGVFIEGIQDSKQTKEEEREAMYEVLINHPDVHWAASVVSHTEIDEVNILQATMNGMRRSTQDLLKKLEKLKLKGSYIALVDGNRVPTEMPVDAQFVIKGDGSIFSIAAASIIAKVTRDRIMLELDKEFPQYNLAQHKGYPTFEHRSLLLKHGPCRIHRTSYVPVKLAMLAHANKAAKSGDATTSVSTSVPTESALEPVSGKRKRVLTASTNEANIVTAKPVSSKKPRTTSAKTSTKASTADSTGTKVKTGAKKAPVKTGKVAPEKTVKGKSVATKSTTSAKKSTRGSKTDSLVNVTAKPAKEKKVAAAKVTAKNKVDDKVDKPRRSTRSSSA